MATKYKELKQFSLFKFRGKTFMKVSDANAVTSKEGKDSIFAPNEVVVPLPNVKPAVCALGV